MKHISIIVWLIVIGNKLINQKNKSNNNNKYSEKKLKKSITLFDL